MLVFSLELYNMKECTVCKAEKEYSDFYSDKRNSDTLRSECKNCHSARSKKYYLKHKDRIIDQVSNSFRYVLYGLTKEKYDEMVKLQDNKCAICHKKETGSWSNGKSYKPVKPLSVDHDHTTTQVRGLLCDNCNNGIARFNDDPKLLISQQEGYYNG